MEVLDCVVIGAGVVGLAIAREMAMLGRDVIVLESENTIGTGISSRNSEVIHAGIYYPKNSLKAQLCVQGKALLYDYVVDRAVEYENCGKIIVATNKEQNEILREINQKAIDNNVCDLRFISSKEAQNLEPSLFCHSALLSPSTGIIDTHAFMLSLQGDIEDRGGICVLNSEVKSGEIIDSGIMLLVECDNNVIEIKAKTVINSAGLGAIPIAKRFRNFPTLCIPDSYYAKGNYFGCTQRNPFSHLIYPVPEKDGLGIHLTFDLAMKAKFGPDVEWIDSLDFTVDPARSVDFYKAIRTYWPDLKDYSLYPDYAGIRPKINGPQALSKDFIIQGTNIHGIENLVHLFGIESPGLTSSLGIANYVAKLLS